MLSGGPGDDTVEVLADGVRRALEMASAAPLQSKSGSLHPSRLFSDVVAEGGRGIGAPGRQGSAWGFPPATRPAPRPRPSEDAGRREPKVEEAVKEPDGRAGAGGAAGAGGLAGDVAESGWEPGVGSTSTSDAAVVATGRTALEEAVAAAVAAAMATERGKWQADLATERTARQTVIAAERTARERAVWKLTQCLAHMCESSALLDVKTHLQRPRRS
jgi:hypothetical protein